MEEKHKGLIIEKALESKFVTEKSRTNGHDCWGNLEWTTDHYIEVKRKEEMIFKTDYVIHDGTEVLFVCKEEQLPYHIEKIVKQRELDAKLTEVFLSLSIKKPLSYSDRLKAEIEFAKIKHPKLAAIFETVRKINAKSTMEYDYEIERTAEMYREVAKILDAP